MNAEAIAEAPEQTIDLREARGYCEHATKRIRELLAARAVIEQSQRDQLEEIRSWFEQEVGKLDSEVTRLKLQMQPLVAALVDADALQRKSAEFVAGRAGFRQKPPSVVKEDEAAAVAWLRENAPDCLRVPEPSVDLKAVKERFPVKGERFHVTSDGEIIPGLCVPEPETGFYVDVIGNRKEQGWRFRASERGIADDPH